MTDNPNQQPAVTSPLPAWVEQITALPREGTRVADLTDRDRLAIAMAAGVPMDVTTEHRDGGFFAKVTSRFPFGIADRGDGGYIVGVRRG